MGELVAGGYSKEWRIEALKSAIAGYGRMWQAEVEGTGHINRPEYTTWNKRTTMLSKEKALGR